MNIKEIDKWLDEEYGCSYTRLEELFNFEIDKQLKLFDKVEQLEKKTKKYKEVIEKIKTRYCDYYGTTKEINDDYVLRNVLKEISDILKEVE